MLVSPVVESCPSDNKEKAMSMLHSFYCWGHVGGVLLSTLFFQAAGIENWKILAAMWAIVPLVNAFVFTKVPMAPLMEEGETGIGIRKLFGMKIFWVLLIMMICAGAVSYTHLADACHGTFRGAGGRKTGIFPGNQVAQ